MDRLRLEFGGRRVRQIISSVPYFIGLGQGACLPQIRHCSLLHNAKVGEPRRPCVNVPSTTSLQHYRRLRAASDRLPATAHFEMLANLQDALPARTAVSKSSRSWSRCSWPAIGFCLTGGLSTRNRISQEQKNVRFRGYSGHFAGLVAGLSLTQIGHSLDRTHFHSRE